MPARRGRWWTGLVSGFRTVRGQAVLSSTGRRRVRRQLPFARRIESLESRCLLAGSDLLGTPFPISENPIDASRDVGSDTNANGVNVAAWFEPLAATPGEYELVARSFTTAGVPLTDPVVVAQDAAARAAGFPRVAVAADGSYFVSWNVWNSGGRTIWLRKIGPSGIPAGPAVAAATVSPFYAVDERELIVPVDILPDGSALVGWVGSEASVWLREFSSTGLPAGPAVLVREPTAWYDVQRPVLRIGAQGGVMAWAETPDTAQPWVEGRLISVEVDLQAPELTLLEAGYFYGSGPTLAVRDDGSFVVVTGSQTRWFDADGDLESETPPGGSGGSALPSVLLNGDRMFVNGGREWVTEIGPLGTWTGSRVDLQVGAIPVAGYPLVQGEGGLPVVISLSYSSGAGPYLVGLPIVNFGPAVTTVDAVGNNPGSLAWSIQDDAADFGPDSTGVPYYRSYEYALRGDPFLGPLDQLDVGFSEQLAADIDWASALQFSRGTRFVNLAPVPASELAYASSYDPLARQTRVSVRRLDGLPLVPEGLWELTVRGRLVRDTTGSLLDGQDPGFPERNAVFNGWVEPQVPANGQAPIALYADPWRPGDYTLGPTSASLAQGRDGVTLIALRAAEEHHLPDSALPVNKLSIFIRQLGPDGIWDSRLRKITLADRQLRGNPAIASDAGGNFLVAWVDYAGPYWGSWDGDTGQLYDGILRLQRFDATGQPVGNIRDVAAVYGAADDQKVHLAMSPQGSAVVGWTSQQGVWLQRLGSDDSPLGSPTLAVEDTHPWQWVSDFSLGIQPDGTALVTWRNGEDTGQWLGDILSASQIWFRLFDTQNQAKTPPVLVDETFPPQPDLGTAGTAQSPAAAVRPDGSIVVTWVRNDAQFEINPPEVFRASGTNRVLLRRYSSDGVPLGTGPSVVDAISYEVDLLSPPPTYFTLNSQPNLAIGPGGDIAVGWLRGPLPSTETEAYDIYVRRYTPLGQAAGPAERLDATFEDPFRYDYPYRSTLPLTTPAMLVQDDGQILVSWRSSGYHDRYFNRSFNELNIYRQTGLTPLAGDANHDGIVGAADYAIWAAQFGRTGTDLAADFDANGEVGTADYAIWAANFGKSAGSLAGVAGVTLRIAPGAALAAGAEVPFVGPLPAMTDSAGPVLTKAGRLFRGFDAVVATTSSLPARVADGRPIKPALDAPVGQTNDASSPPRGPVGRKFAAAFDRVLAEF